MAMSVIQACRSLALSTWLLSFCFVHLLCLDFTVAEKEEWYTAFVNITYPDPGGGGGGGGSELRSEKTECGRYGEHSPKNEVWGQVVMTSATADRQACDPNARFAVPGSGKLWIALVPRGNCSYKDKIRHAASQNASAVVIYNVGSSNANETLTMPPAGEWEAQPPPPTHTHVRLHVSVGGFHFWTRLGCQIAKEVINSPGLAGRNILRSGYAPVLLQGKI